MALCSGGCVRVFFWRAKMAYKPRMRRKVIMRCGDVVVGVTERSDAVAQLGGPIGLRGEVVEMLDAIGVEWGMERAGGKFRITAKAGLDALVEAFERAGWEWESVRCMRRLTC